MEPDEIELSEELFGPPSITPLEAVKEAFMEFKENMAPGLTWDNFSHDVLESAEHMRDLGRSELANALFGHGAFVLYNHEPKNENFLQGQNDPEQAPDVQDMQHDVQGPRLRHSGPSL